ncbi:MAG: DoxX family protein [Paludibacteraceae bacterium]
MNEIQMKHRFLFPASYNDLKSSILLLFLRLAFGGMLMTHGVNKWLNFDSLKDRFPDPLHVGSCVSLSMVIFAEVVCCLGFITGTLFRLALLPMMFSMFMIVFVVNEGQPFAPRELAALYFSLFLVCFAAGPGSMSLDRQWIRRMMGNA